MKHVIAFFGLFLTTYFVSALTLQISWSPIPANQSNQLYRVYVSTNNGPFLYAVGTTGTTVFLSNVAPGLWCARVTSSNIWTEQIPSDPACALGPVVVPDKVTNVNVLLIN
jgi:hypothetical protein